MFSVTVRSHVMVAHSLRGAIFGPAQRLHGVTYVIEATFRRSALGSSGVVADLAAAAAALREVLDPWDYRNLDTEPDLAGVNTTTEVLARLVADRLAERIRSGALGDDGAAIEGIAVTLHESPTASAGYERAV